MHLLNTLDAKTIIMAIVVIGGALLLIKGMNTPPRGGQNGGNQGGNNGQNGGYSQPNPPVNTQPQQPPVNNQQYQQPVNSQPSQPVNNGNNNTYR